MKVDNTNLSLNWIWRQKRESDDVATLSLHPAELQAHRDGWLPAASVPSEIHVELLKVNKIPHPYLGFNEHKVQCEYSHYTSQNLDSVHTVVRQGSERPNGYTLARSNSILTIALRMRT